MEDISIANAAILPLTWFIIDMVKRVFDSSRRGEPAVYVIMTSFTLRYQDMLYTFCYG